MNYSKVLYFDTANSHGLSTTLWVSGCEQHCEDCFNSETWDFNAGKLFDKSIEDKIIESLKNPHIKNFVLLGGDPCHPRNLDTVTKFCREIRDNDDIKNRKEPLQIIVYTGFTLENFLKIDNAIDFLQLIDIMIDGRYDKSRPTKILDFRGSTNQQAYKFYDNGLNWENISKEYFKEES
jgi:anaerobic ribonucleoside-triphosphate reductase activating protein